MEPAVHPVGNARERHAPSPSPSSTGGSFSRAGKVQLEIQRLEVRAAQLIRHIRHDLPHIARQTAEEVDKARALLLKVVELGVYICFHVPGAYLRQLAVVHGAPAAALLDLACGLFEHEMHERAYLRRGEARGLIGLRAQTVLAEVRISARGKFIYSRRAQPQTLAVETAHRGGLRLPRVISAARAIAALRSGWVSIKYSAAAHSAPVPPCTACAASPRAGAGADMRASSSRPWRGVMPKSAAARLYTNAGRMLAVAVRQRAEHRQALRRERQAIIYERELAPQLALPSPAEIDPCSVRRTRSASENTRRCRLRAADARRSRRGR